MREYDTHRAGVKAGSSQNRKQAQNTNGERARDYHHKCGGGGAASAVVMPPQAYRELQGKHNKPYRKQESTKTDNREPTKKLNTENRHKPTEDDRQKDKRRSMHRQRREPVCRQRLV